MNKIRHSPEHGQLTEKFLKKELQERPDDPALFAALDELQQHKEKLEESSNQKDNLEYDLRTSDYIAEKCKSVSYAQNLYAALCNRDFIRNDVWPILQEKLWSCSWRYAGGIVADICETGDYIDWYCSGIRGENMSQEDFNKLSDEQRKNYLDTQQFVSEGEVTDEIRADLLKLGWLTLDDDESDAGC